MGILIYTESENGKFKKSALELASYGRSIADQLEVELIAASFNHSDTKTLGTYGVDRVIQISDPSLENFTAQQYAANLTSVAQENGVKLVVLSSSANAKYLAPLLTVSLSAGYASNVVGLPESLKPLTVKRSCFTNKAFNICVLDNEVNIIGLSNNSFGLRENHKEITTALPTARKKGILLATHSSSGTHNSGTLTPYRALRIAFDLSTENNSQNKTITSSSKHIPPSKKNDRLGPVNDLSKLH